MGILVAGLRSRRAARAACLGVLAAGLVLPAAARASQVLSLTQAQYKSLLACPTTLDHIGRVVIPVEVDGRGPFRFVIDTGASHSTVSPQLVRALGLTINKAARVDLQGVTGSAPAPTVTLRTLRAGALVLRHASVPVLSTPMMADTDGILGIAGMPELSLLVNFQSNRVRIARGLEPDIRFDYSRVHTRVVSGGLMAITAYVGNVKTLAIVDTGSERTLGNLALRRALHPQRSATKPEPITVVYGATKQVEIGRMAASPTLALGPLRITDVQVIFGDFHIFDVWGLEKQPAMILGMDVLGTVDALGFDFGQHDLFVASARAGGNPFSGTHAYAAPQKIH